MIALNFTLFVEFGLFMIFLGITNVFIYRPLLRVMDERAEKLDRATAKPPNRTSARRRRSKSVLSRS